MILKFFNRRSPRRIFPLFLLFILSCGCAQLHLSEAAANDPFTYEKAIDEARKLSHVPFQGPDR